MPARRPRGAPYFVMELRAGRADHHPTAIDTASRASRTPRSLFEQVCEGVQHAHQKGIIHRDLKPSNVLVTRRRSRSDPQDYRLRRRQGDCTIADREARCSPSWVVFIGTPEYMSPEQAEMSALDIDTRTDIYALGVLLYELLTGFLPIDRSTLRQAGLDGIRRLIREEEPAKPYPHHE